MEKNLYLPQLKKIATTTAKPLYIMSMNENLKLNK